MATAARTVRDAMTASVATLRRNDVLGIADEVMRLGRIRHLPVVEDDDETSLAGIITQRDLFRGSLARALGFGEVAQRRLLDTLVVKEVMTTEVVTVAPDTALDAAASLMMTRKIGCLPVVEDGRLIGILTEGDFVRLAAAGG
jgi:CBS domain-containing protein